LDWIQTINYNFSIFVIEKLCFVNFWTSFGLNPDAGGTNSHFLNELPMLVVQLHPLLLVLTTSPWNPEAVFPNLIFTSAQRWARTRTGSDWIRTEVNFGRIRTGSDCNIFQNWRIRTGSDWENFCCFNV